MSKNVTIGTAKFNSLSQDLGGFVEQLAPGCFARSLKVRTDVLMFHNHNSADVLARVSAGNLKVNEDSIGLAFRAELPDTTLADDVFENCAVGNIQGMSFGMRCQRDSWEDNYMLDGQRIPLRTILDCDLLEISSTPVPAYLGTSVDAATRALFPDGIPAELRSRLRPLTDDDLETLRLRLRRRAAATRI